MPDPPVPSRGALLRDVLIFQVKLGLDGLKDLVLSPASIAAAVVDFVFRTRLFYVVLRVGERFDLWLNLFGAAQRAGREREGLFGASRAGDPTLLGQLERLGGGEPPASRPGVPPPTRSG
ncbi:MAG TPA: hypothetical protein VHG51_03740 [Longimicrobiaceae bacterium]|nr:hypothetical protein [Longimicrobiaceae bacterium]